MQKYSGSPFVPIITVFNCAVQVLVVMEMQLQTSNVAQLNKSYYKREQPPVATVVWL